MAFGRQQIPPNVHLPLLQVPGGHSTEACGCCNRGRSNDGEHYSPILLGTNFIKILSNFFLSFQAATGDCSGG